MNMASNNNKGTPASKVEVSKLDRSVISAATILLLFCVIVSTVVLGSLYHYRDTVYCYTGGKIFTDAKSGQTSREALGEHYKDKSGEELDEIKCSKAGNVLRVSQTPISYWASQIVYNGWIPYAIILGFLTGLFYTIGSRLLGLIPSWHLSGKRRRFHFIAQQIAALRQSAGQVRNMADILERVGGKDRFAKRLIKLQLHYRREPNRQLCREANEAYSQSDQAEVLYLLLPLGFIEFLLPILGFVGTVLGVSHAVGALRLGMMTLFKVQELNEAVISQFMAGFDGLVLAFMTTLFGLLGLAVTAFFRFYLRRNAIAVIAKIDKWSEESINLLPEQDLMTMIAQGLIVYDENGNPVLDDQNRPIPRWAEVLAETDEDGMPLRDEQGKIISRLSTLNELIQTGLFEPSEDDEKPLPALLGVRRMLSSLTGATQQIHNALMRHIYQIVGYDDRDQYTKLTVYVKDEETDETQEVEVQGRLRSERQHSEQLAWIGMYSEKIIEIIRQSPPPGEGTENGTELGHMLVQSEEEPVRHLAASSNGFAIVRGPAGNTGDNEIVSGSFEAIVGEMQARVCDKVHLGMPVGGLGFSRTGRGKSNRFVAYLPFASAWQEYGTKQLLPTSTLVNCKQSFLDNHDVLSSKVAVMEDGNARQSLFIIARNKKNEKSQIFSIPTDGEKREPQPLGKAFEGEVVAEAMLPGMAYTFVYHEGDGARIATVFSKQAMDFYEKGGKKGQTKMHLMSGGKKGRINALGFDKEGVLHYASEKGEVGSVDWKSNKFNPQFTVDSETGIVAIEYASNSSALLAFKESPKLIIASPGNDGDVEIKTNVYPQVITALACDQEGRHIFVGCADGSVYFRKG